MEAKKMQKKNDLSKIGNEIIKLVHYSTTEGLKELDVNKMGTGIRSEESKYGTPNCKYLCFYRDGSVIESGADEDLKARAKYFAVLNPEQKLYDIGMDIDNIQDKCLAEQKIRYGKDFYYIPSDMYKQKVKDAGYYGFYNSLHSNLGLSNAVCIFYSHPVEEDLTFYLRRKIKPDL